MKHVEYYIAIDSRSFKIQTCQTQTTSRAAQATKNAKGVAKVHTMQHFRKIVIENDFFHVYNIFSA